MAHFALRLAVLRFHPDAERLDEHLDQDDVAAMAPGSAADPAADPRRHPRVAWPGPAMGAAAALSLATGPSVEQAGFRATPGDREIDDQLVRFEPRLVSRRQQGLLRQLLVRLADGREHRGSRHGQQLHAVSLCSDVALRVLRRALCAVLQPGRSTARPHTDDVRKWFEANVGRPPTPPPAPPQPTPTPATIAPPAVRALAARGRRT